jgi:hypothetical protein
MRIANRKIIYILVALALTLLCLFTWLAVRPVNIIAVHEIGSSDAVLVDHFPITMRGKIDWWQKNKDMLKLRYGIPKAPPHESFNITFWRFGEGYMEQGKYDRLCFIDMKTDKNCIEKEKAFTVNYSKNTGLYFTGRDGYYRLKDNGEIKKIKIY